MRLLRAVCLVAGMVVFCGPALKAQISDGGFPPSLGKLSLSAVTTVTTPSVDVKALLAEDEVEEAQGFPFRFGAPFDVDYSLTNSGTWSDLADGGRIWRLRVSSPGAYSINLVYSRYRLPPGAELFVYDESHEMVLGAFTEHNNKDHGMFATAPVKGEVCIVEYYEPASVRGSGEITISRIVHGYKDIFGFGGTKGAAGFGGSGPCNNNINCPEGAPWQIDKRAVAMILTSGGSRICSGALVNNVRQDRTPYFLTANHCLGSEPTWIFMFNYESPSCVSVDGPTYMTVQGSTRRATYVPSDFALVQISEQPPDSYNVFFAGWTNIDTPSQSSVGIHHPSGDIKKISFDYDPVTSTDYLGSSGTTHWRIEAWDDGTTEGGSSGSPLFDPDHRIVGQLHGGYASCTSLTSDWYGKFSLSWTGGGTSSTRLRDWLDPDNSGATVLDGYDPYGIITISHDPLPNTKDTVSDYDVVCTITSNADLVPSSLLLHYELSSTWFEQQLQATGNPDQYHGYIPAQPVGTTIGYFLTATDVDGSADTTDTFSFLVEYSAAISVMPPSLVDTVIVTDSIIDALTIQNSGNGALDYSIRVVTGPKNTQPDKGLGGPDNYGHVWIDSDEPSGPDFTWIDISGTGTDVAAALTDDNYAGPYPIGFIFPYYENNYSQFYIGSNGIIGFDTAYMHSRYNAVLPTVDIPNNILAWLWDDLNPDDPYNTNAHVYYHSDGGQLVIQFADYPEYGANPGEVVNAEVILNADGTILYQYQTISPGFDAVSCAVGIENADGTDGLTAVYHATYLHDNLAIKFGMAYQWLNPGRYAGSVLPGAADTIPVVFKPGLLDTGLYNALMVITSNDPDPGDNPVEIPAQMVVVPFPNVCGDANGDDFANVADAVFLITYVFKGGPAPDPYCAADANGDNLADVADAVYLINYVFRSGPPPISPCCP